MQVNKEVDYLVVGQGLAGSVLSLELIRRGKSVLVFNEDKAATSSKVAGGLFNPVTGKKMQLTWLAGKLFPHLYKFYKEAEKVLGENFFHPLVMYRPFKKTEEKNEWMGYSSNEEVQFFVKEILDKSLYAGILNDELGGLILNYSGYLDVPKFLKAVREFLLVQGAYREEYFNEKELLIQKKLVVYKGISAKFIIFCDGTEGKANRFFHWLPFSPVKGELLHIKPEHKIDHIINRGVFIIPGPDNICKVGATYEWDELDNKPTQRGRAELENRLREIYKGNYEIVNHMAGIRPATKDRKPFLGRHPEHETIGVFNGLGTKGVSLAPYFANHFCNYLENNDPLIPEINIERYFSFYKN